MHYVLLSLAALLITALTLIGYKLYEAWSYRKIAAQYHLGDVQQARLHEAARVTQQDEQWLSWQLKEDSDPGLFPPLQEQ